MSNQDRLLSDEELAERVAYLIDTSFALQPEILDLINTQKRLYAEEQISRAAGELTYHFYPFGNEEKDPEAEGAIKVIEDFTLEQRARIKS